MNVFLDRFSLSLVNGVEVVVVVVVVWLLCQPQHGASLLLFSLHPLLRPQASIRLKKKLM